MTVPRSTACRAGSLRGIVRSRGRSDRSRDLQYATRCSATIVAVSKSNLHILLRLALSLAAALAIAIPCEWFGIALARGIGYVLVQSDSGACSCGRGSSGCDRLPSECRERGRRASITEATTIVSKATRPARERCRQRCALPAPASASATAHSRPRRPGRRGCRRPKGRSCRMRRASTS